MLGATIGAILPIKLEGIEFCMTAMFITIVIDQWESHHHFPTIMSAIVALVLLGLLKSQHFMLPSLLLATLIMVLYTRRIADE